MRVVQIIMVVVILAGLAVLFWPASGEHELANFTTSLTGRTRGQRINARKAAQALHGVVIESGQIFSFNKTVGSWTADRGYVKAPVSYDGELMVDWGGGVCQTSTTLYNAALLAGLEIVQRHRHDWAPQYIPPGRDAAVAQMDIDLQLRNPYPWPVEIRTDKTDNQRLAVQILGRARGPMAEITGELQASTLPNEVLKVDSRYATGQRRILNQGRPGTRVAIYRLFRSGPKAGQRELVSQDDYPAMNRVVLLGK